MPSILETLSFWKDKPNINYDPPRHFVLIKFEDPRLSCPLKLEELLEKRTDKELKEAGLPFYAIGTPIEGMSWKCNGRDGPRHDKREPFKVGRAPKCHHETPQGRCERYMRTYGPPTPLYICKPKESDEYRSCGYYSPLRIDYKEEPHERTICLGCGRKSFQRITGPEVVI